MMHLLLIQGVFALSVVQSAESLSVGQAIARAREARPRLSAAAAVVERARGAARLGSLIPNPSSQFELDESSPTRKVTVTQSLAWLPRHAADRAAGRFLIRRAVADSARTVADVVREVRRAFFGSLAADRQATLAEEQRALADSVAGLARRRAAEGAISNLERDQIVTEAARARLNAWQTREERDVAVSELSRVLAWQGLRPPRPVGRLDDGLSPEDTVVHAASDALGSLPAVRAAIADSSAAAQRLRAARISRVPIPGLVVGREWGGTAAENLILGLALPISLFSTGGEAVQQARGDASLQAALLAEARESVRTQLRSARVRSEQSARRALFARDSLLPRAQGVRVGALRLYEAGGTNVLPVLDALRTEREITRLAIAELLAYQQARADLDALLGRTP